MLSTIDVMLSCVHAKERRFKIEIGSIREIEYSNREKEVLSIQAAVYQDPKDRRSFGG